MAIAWAAQRIAAEDPDAVMAVLSADHHIPDDRAFAADIRRAARAAADEHVLVTLGVKPTRPDPGLGYIRLGSEVGAAHPGLHHVARFVEKPDLTTAKRYVRGGRHLWNAGIFIWRAETVLDEIRSCAPDLHRALAPLRKRPRGRNAEAVRATYRRAPSLPIDVAVMERSDRVWTVPVEFEWSDVGTWASLAEELGVGTPETAAPGRTRGPRGDEAGNRVIAGDVVVEAANDNLVWGGERLIALVGVDDLAIIDTEDVILVTRLSRSSDVRRIVTALKDKGRDRLT
jgi:mannose-1-phosphate guanylyltransferase